MSDYIKREDAIRIARIQGKNAQFDGMAQDVAPVRHGRWEEYGKTWWCSECGFETGLRWDYCPDCGAKMDEDTEY